MRDKLALGGKLAQIGTIFTNHHLCGPHSDRIDLGEVHAAHPVKGLPGLLPPTLSDGFGLLRTLVLRRLPVPALLPLHSSHQVQNLFLISGDSLLDGVIHIQGLPHTKQVVLPPMPAELLGNLLLALAATPIPQLS